MFKTLFIKDPCKKCIVRACCNNKCDTKIYFKKFIYPFNSNDLWQKKLIAWLTIGSRSNSCSNFNTDMLNHN
jgi:hypothetical protein